VNREREKNQGPLLVVNYYQERGIVRGPLASIGRLGPLVSP
jgi:hypothetical protein